MRRWHTRCCPRWRDRPSICRSGRSNGAFSVGCWLVLPWLKLVGPLLGALPGEFCAGCAPGRVLPGEFCTGWGAGGVLLGEFCTGWAKKGPCRAVFAAIPRPTLRCTCPLQRHAATIATTPRHSASRRNRVTAPPGRNIAPLPDPATVTPAKARQARHNKARSRDGSADDGLFFGHTDDAGALAQG